MKKMLLNIGFTLLCVGAFFTAIGFSFKVMTTIIVEKAYAAWRVSWSDEVGRIYRDIDYDETEQIGYDLYVPAQANKTTAQSLIVYIHGGGFTSGDKADGEMLCKYFAANGYICASVNYALNDGRHKTNYNKMYEQILVQVASIQNKTNELGYTVTEMAVSGDSAGGYLAMLYAYRAKEDSPIPVKLVFQMTGPATFAPSEWDITETKDIITSITRLSGKEVTEEMIISGEIDTIIKEISPALLVDENTVPTVMAYGPKDKVVRINLKYALIDSLEKNGIDYTFIEFPNSGHAMLFDPDKTQEYVDTVNVYLEKYMENHQNQNQKTI